MGRRRNALKTTPAKTTLIAVSLPPAVLAQVDRICVSRRLSRAAVLGLIVENSPHLRLARSHIFRVPRAASVRIQKLLEKDPTRIWRVSELMEALKLDSPHTRVTVGYLVKRGVAVRLAHGRYVAAAGAEEARLALTSEAAAKAASEEGGRGKRPAVR